MAWSETMFIIQHFYNVFDIDRRLTDVEYKSPLVAKNIGGSPELPTDITVDDLTPGTLWFIQDDNIPTMVTAVSVLKDDNTFDTPIPFSVDLSQLPLSSDLQTIASRMGLTTQNYYDIIKSMLEILEKVPVERGGTGLSSISKDKMLIGDSGNTFKEIGFDSTPTQRSENLVNSGALYNQFDKMAEKFHASRTDIYGLGSLDQYGHLRITNDYEELGTDPTHTAVSVAAVSDLLKNLQKNINLFQVIDNNGNEVTDKNAKDSTLYSGCISAYRPEGMSLEELKLIGSYFSIETNNTGDYTLIIN